ncbi:erythromycin esterase family protein [Saccharothrix luteola]|uniref:erythromycin esterase family protein n=1 Tax=Saccharothrix luteola TaxID=2893018 RepID=UPI001E60FC72|nr:erythromycin esterase family protein [Saccharothrix luteola]MCC8246129.1 erythromycin esterase family protein [Saccharothrix luteola]
MDRYGDEVAAMAAPLRDAGDFDVLLDRVGGARVVMLGEASHGTHEFYRWRAALTSRLIVEKGFSFVAVEGDWPACDRVDRVDRSVRGPPDAPEDPRAAPAAFDRWPTWMWANEEVVDFCRWLRAHNAVLAEEERVAFHGLDVYSLWESLREILTHLREHDPQEVPTAPAAYRCFEPHGEDPREYAISTRFVPAGCEDEVVDLLVRLRRQAAGDGAGRFAAWQNAEVVAGAERYYRAMVGGQSSWNVRDRHMDDTLDRLLDHAGDAGTAGPPGSLGDVLHGTAPDEALFVFPHDDQPDLLTATLPHRAIGVVYHPERERCDRCTRAGSTCSNPRRIRAVSERHQVPQA